MTGTCVLLTSTTARRCAASGLASTLYATLPLPCPVVSPVSCAHGELLDADQVQSRVVVTATEPDPPAGGIFVEMEFSAET